MNPEIKERWVAALRSGEYRQGTKYLYAKYVNGIDEYCCLGVLCEIAVADGVIRHEKKPTEEGPDFIHLYGQPPSSEFVLPAEVVEWAETGSDDPLVIVGPTGEEIELTYLNDGILDPFLQFSFPEIADLIEEQL